MDKFIEATLIEIDARYKSLPQQYQEYLKRVELLFKKYSTHESLSFESYVLFQQLTEILALGYDKIPEDLLNTLDELNALFYTLTDDNTLFNNLEMDYSEIL